MIEPHATRTPSGIELPDPDQGTPYILISFAMPSTSLMVWEPFEDETPGGHNIFGFARRWREWVASDAPELQAVEPRFGFPMVIPRSCIPHVIGFRVDYHRKEDTRAGVRESSLSIPGQPKMRRRRDGSIEIQVPR